MNLTKAEWRKSSHSGSNGGQCVEVAFNLPGVVAIRDSKNPEGATLAFAPEQWRAFLAGARADEFGLRASLAARS